MNHDQRYRDVDVKVVTPTGIQCPKCGVPRPTIELDNSDEVGVRFYCCGTVITIIAMCDAFGVDPPA